MRDQASRWGEPPRPATITVRGTEPEETAPGYRQTAKRPTPTIVITRRWKGRNMGCLVSFLIVWFVALGLWYASVLGSDDVDWFSLLCPVVHVLAGLLLLGVVLRQLLNVSIIQLTEATLTCRTAPIARRTAERYPVGDIERAVHTTRGQGPAHRVELVMRSSRRHRLQVVADEAEALYLVWAIGAWLEEHRGDG